VVLRRTPTRRFSPLTAQPPERHAAETAARRKQEAALFIPHSKYPIDFRKIEEALRKGLAHPLPYLIDRVDLAGSSSTPASSISSIPVERHVSNSQVGNQRDSFIAAHLT